MNTADFATTTDADATPPAGALRPQPWLREGLRTAVLRAPRLDHLPPTGASPWLAMGFVLVSLALGIAVQRLALPDATEFQLGALTQGWLGTAIAVWASWWVLTPGRAGGAARLGVASLMTLLLAQGLCIGFLTSVVALAMQHAGVAQRITAGSAGAWLVWGWWWFSLLWMVVAQLVLLARCAVRDWKRVAPVLALLMAAGTAVGVLHPQMHWWEPDYEARDDGASRVLRLSEAVIETQQRVAAEALAQLPAQRPGRIDTYVLTFAPYGAEDVFRRESALVASTMAERFGADGRTLQLVNHPRTADEFTWATPRNLQRAIARVAAVMDRDEDLLFIHLTSHGARDGRLAASHYPLDVEGLTPADLRRWLDEAGIRHRVVSVSACYAGSWIAPLQGDATLVMTAADAEHSSYGCGSRSELTYFGRAMFAEQLRATRDFEQAHAAARTAIEAREKEAGKSDGYSNPQISVGATARARLAKLASQLDAEAAAPAGMR